MLKTILDFLARALEQQNPAMNIVTSTHFPEFSYKDRLSAYQMVGIISRWPICNLECWMEGWLDDETDDRVPKQIPRHLLHTSKELLDDALSMFWRENDFKLHGIALLGLLRLGTPIAWSSLRNLEVLLPMKSSMQPGESGALENVTCLRCWQQVCTSLGAYSPPSRLKLQFGLIQNGVAARDQAAIAKEALYSMRALPMLSELSFQIHPVGFRDIWVHHMATDTVKRLTTGPSTKRPPFRFMDLPTETQFMILEHTDLVAPGPVIASDLKGYALDSCWTSCRREEFQCCEKANYDSTKGCCWSLPTNLFLVNSHISAMSGEVFFSCNDFVVDVCAMPITSNNIQRARPAPLFIFEPDPSPRVPGVWCPENSEFLLSFPSTCIRRLKSFTWRFNMLNHYVAFSPKQKADWNSTINFIAENVHLPRLTITFDMTKSHLRDEVMDPVKKLKGLGGLVVRLSRDLDAKVRAAEELRLERLAMGDRYRPTVEELKAWEDERQY